MAIFSKIASFTTVLSLLHLINGQAVDFCTDDDCASCPASITTAGAGKPSCVIYDTETVLGGLGFEEGTGDILYKTFPNFPDPGPGCNIQIRSPASIEAEGCGLLIFNTNQPKCDRDGTNLKESFMVQFCCGVGDCGDLPIKARGIGGHSPRSIGSGAQYLQYPNGTIIPPKEVGDVVVKKQDCNDGYRSYVPDGEPYIKTGETIFVSDPVSPTDEDQVISLTYSQEISETTSFSTSVGDPFGIVSVTVGFEFTTSTASEENYQFTVPGGSNGRVGWTPYYRCTRGEIEQCEGGTKSTGEACTADTSNNGKPTGEYSIVDS